MALRAESYAQAANLLNELDRQVPAGKMMEEREAAFVVTRCALGLGDPKHLARAFRNDYPHSVYWERIRTRCGLLRDEK